MDPLVEEKKHADTLLNELIAAHRRNAPFELSDWLERIATTLSSEERISVLLDHYLLCFDFKWSYMEAFVPLLLRLSHKNKEQFFRKTLHAGKMPPAAFWGCMTSLPPKEATQLTMALIKTNCTVLSEEEVEALLNQENGYVLPDYRMQIYALWKRGQDKDFPVAPMALQAINERLQEKGLYDKKNRNLALSVLGQKITPDLPEATHTTYITAAYAYYKQSGKYTEAELRPLLQYHFFNISNADHSLVQFLHERYQADLQDEQILIPLEVCDGYHCNGYWLVLKKSIISHQNELHIFAMKTNQYDSWSHTLTQKSIPHNLYHIDTQGSYAPTQKDYISCSLFCKVLTVLTRKPALVQHLLDHLQPISDQAFYSYPAHEEQLKYCQSSKLAGLYSQKKPILLGKRKEPSAQYYASRSTDFLDYQEKNKISVEKNNWFLLIEDWFSHRRTAEDLAYYQQFLKSETYPLLPEKTLKKNPL